MISIKDAALKLDLTPQQVRNLCRENKIEAEKIGSSWVLKEENVEYYKSHNNCGSTNDKYLSVPNENSEINFKQPIALSFFSGAMGMDIGIEKAGFKILLACETDKACRKTIAKNRPDIALIGNIEDYSATEIRRHAGLSNTDDIDLITGGPPCQAFSTAGKRKGFKDSRGNVLLTFLDRIIDLNPKFAVIENVRGLLSAPLKHRPHDQRGSNFPPLEPEEVKGGALLHILNVLREQGYGVSFNLYNAANFGTPQKRERIIIVASRDGQKLPFLTPTNSENGEYGLATWNSFKKAVKGLSALTLNHLNFPEKRLKYYKMLGPGEYWRNLPINLQKEALGKTYFSGGGRTGFYRRLSWDKPSPTLVTHPAMPATDLAHPEENRPLSIEEYKRIQQFPDDWQIEGSLVEQYKQVGNAVPVGLGKAVGLLIMNHILGERILIYENFKYSRYNNTDDKTWEFMIRKSLNQYNLAI
jgi:DNA (cytosine-5)-methyltransferase 1